MKIRHLALSLSVAMGALLAGTVHAAELKIAIVQSLTGPAAFIGAPAAEGLKMAFDEANEKKLLGDNTITYSTEDDASDKAQVITLINRHASDPATVFFAGPTSGAVSGVAAKAANDAGIPMMTVSNVVEVREAGPWSFITTQPGPVGVPRIAEYAAKTVGVKTCQTVGITDNESYVTQARIFTDTLAKNNVEVMEGVGLKSTETDFSAVSVRVVDGGADCVFVAAPASMAANIIIQLKQAGLDPETKVFGMTSMASPDLIRIGGEAVEGVMFLADWVPGGSSPEGKSFAEAFKARTGRDAGNWDAIGYSSGMVIVAAIKAAGDNPTREAVRDALTASKDVPVVVGDGKFSLDKDKVPHFGINVLTVKDGAFVAAPQ